MRHHAVLDRQLEPVKLKRLSGPRGQACWVKTVQESGLHTQISLMSTVLI